MYILNYNTQTKLLISASWNYFISYPKLLPSLK